MASPRGCAAVERVARSGPDACAWVCYIRQAPGRCAMRIVTLHYMNSGCYGNDGDDRVE